MSGDDEEVRKYSNAPSSRSLRVLGVVGRTKRWWNDIKIPRSRVASANLDKGQVLVILEITYDTYLPSIRSFISTTTQEPGTSGQYTIPSQPRPVDLPNLEDMNTFSKRPALLIWIIHRQRPEDAGRGWNVSAVDQGHDALHLVLAGYLI
jgi:hypothetical protein